MSLLSIESRFSLLNTTIQTGTCRASEVDLAAAARHVDAGANIVRDSNRASSNS
jgi:hypothetical protein